MEIIYIDSLFISELLADYLLCLGTGRLCALPLRRGRYLLAALFGACFSVLVFLPGLGFLAKPGWKLLAGGSIGLLAFGWGRKGLGCTGAFLLLSAALGGAAWALELSFGPLRLDIKLLSLFFFISYSLLKLLFSSSGAPGKRAYCRVEIELLGRSTEISALVDSGNCLKDPLSGLAVLLVSPEVLLPLLPGCEQLLSGDDPVELMSLAHELPSLKGRLRLIPYKGLGGEGLLPVLRPQSLRINGRPCKDRLLGISPQAKGAGFEAIL